MTPLTIRCYTANPVAWQEPIMIDGLIGYAHAKANNITPEKIRPLDLPIERLDTVDDLPVYACTALEPINGVEDREQFQKMNRFGVFSKSKRGFKPNQSAGRYQGRSIPIRTILAEYWEARLIGNRTLIENYLTDYITHLGARRGTGLGEILRFEVDEDSFSIEDLITRDGKLQRPIPVVLGYETIDYPYFQGFTPPYWHGEFYADCFPIYGEVK